MSLKLPRYWDFNLKMDMSKIVRSQSMMAVDPKGSGSWSHPPNPLERPLKAGWLKKQRSLVKNWQQRYFVLKGQHLYYYKDEEDLKPQGLVRLHGSAVREVAATSDEVGRFVFEIIPGNSGDQNRTGQDAYVLMANSQADMEEWVKSLRRVVGSPLGVVFGQQLVETMVYEQKFGQHQVPILVEKCVEFIKKHGLNEEGIFRLPGQDNLVKQLRDAFDAGERPSFDQDTDVHTVASLFKLYLRELPEPVIPWTQYEGFLLCGQLLNADEKKGHQQLVKQLALLPRDSYNLLSYICRFLYEVQQSSTTNKMSVENLATVFGVNLIRPKMEDPVTIMRGTPQIQKVMTVMISDHAKLFPVSRDVVPSPPLQKSDSKKAPVARSSVGWDAVQRPLTSRGENRSLCQTKDDLEASSSKLAGGSDTSEEDNGELQPKGILGTCTVQSRKRTQTLPNRKCFLNSSSIRGNQSVDRNDIFSSDFWSSSSTVHPNPVSSVAGHKRTLSQGLSKLLNFSQMSNTDNICDSVPETRKKTQESPLTQISDNSGKGLQTSGSPTPGQNGVPNPSPEDESSSPEDPELLRKIIAGLKMEMETQKKDYEEQIRSLEKENYEVWAKVVKLNEEIEEQKKTNAELERQLQNVTCSRDDTEKKNKRLIDSLQSVCQPAAKAE
ncbi:rho GTPase-activating protein 25 [Elgaria multicarinata webbii]|uniref:rho GTPase-activating protein 25 n=1 Tax=Elgaria multicarinata webbii TaxID=159646 RepID=UPI002FCD3394